MILSAGCIRHQHHQTHEQIIATPHTSTGSEVHAERKGPRIVSPLWRLLVQKVSPIAPFHEGGEGPSVYCVHPIFGDVTSFRDLARSLGPGRRFYGIHVPKDKMNAEFAASIEGMAKYYVDALIAFQPEGPFVLAGWSAGAIVALEMAQQMRALGREVPLLVALDGAPCNTGGGLSRWHPLYYWKLLCNLPGWIKYQVRQDRSWYAAMLRLMNKYIFSNQKGLPSLRSNETLHGKAVQDFLGGTGWMSAQLAFIQAFYDAMRAYVPKPYSGRVVVYEAKTQPLNHLLQIGAAWKKIASDTEIVALEGDHGGIFQEPLVGAATSHLRKRLDELRRSREAAEAVRHATRDVPDYKLNLGTN